MNSSLSKHNLAFSSLLLAALALFLAVPSGLAQWTLNPQEQAIAQKMVNDRDQGRPALTWNPILAQVARARARDLATRDYFDHVNPDGHGPNYMVRQAGYPLPEWWGTDPKANYIESIAGGYASPDDTWNQWMGSPDHRTHILGLNSFYASETCYGIGYYYDAGSTYRHYWVIITAPPPPAPALTISSPAADLAVTSPDVALAGTATAASGVTLVEFRVENAGVIGAYQPASGTTAWSANVLGLQPGVNVIRVRSKNAGGTVIAEAARSIAYVQMGSLTVKVSGSGSVTPGFAGTTSRPVGQNLTLTATPAAGYVFAGWSGDVTAGTRAISFVFQAGMNLTAHFAVNPFAELGGFYNGLIGGSGHTGLMRVALTPGGIASGRVIFDGAAYGFVARFSLDGAADVVIPRAGKTPLALHLGLDLTGVAQQMTGTISDGISTAAVTVDRDVFNPLTNRAPQAGRYTAVIAPDTANPSSPQGDGYAVVGVMPNGLALVAGQLADGTAFTAAGTVSQSGALPLYLGLMRAPAGSVATGTLLFRDTLVSDFDGSLTWKKTARASDALYPAGFTAAQGMVGSRYAVPAAGRNALSPANASSGAGRAALGDGNLGQTLSVATSITPANRIVMSSPGALSLSAAINRFNGVVSGFFIHPGSRAVRVVRGAVLQKQAAAFGFFPGISESGYFSLAAE